jgi:hypothetical protein
MRSQLRNLLRKLLNDADAVHVHRAHAVLTVWAAAAARRINPSMRIVFTPYYHGAGHTPIRKLLWIYWRRHIRKLITTIDVVHIVSKLEAQLIQQDFGHHASRPRPAGRRSGRPSPQAILDVGRRPALPNGRRSQKLTR